MRELYETIRSLKQAPHRGRPGGEKGTREILFPPLPYVAVYRVNERQQTFKFCAFTMAHRSGLRSVPKGAGAQRPEPLGTLQTLYERVFSFSFSRVTNFSFPLVFFDVNYGERLDGSFSRFQPQTVLLHGVKDRLDGLGGCRGAVPSGRRGTWACG